MGFFEQEVPEVKIVAAADHGGVALKDSLVVRLRGLGYEVEDLGTHDSSSVDYPDYAVLAAQRVTSGEADGGLLVCGTGIGMSIAANKVPGAYCAKINSPEEGDLAARHNHANLVALGGRTMDPDTAWASLKAWLDAAPEGGRHERRVKRIAELERKGRA